MSADLLSAAIATKPAGTAPSIPTLTHIFTVGDHYSAKTGSSYPTVIYELNRCHAAAGGASRVIVGRGTIDGYPPYEVGECVEVGYQPFPSRRLRMVDTALGSIGLRRTVKWKAYKAALDAIRADSQDWLMVHGEPAIVPWFRRYRPSLKIALYCHYELFRWYTSGEVRRIAQNADALVCVSAYIQKYVHEKAGRKLPNTHVVLNGIDAARFHASGRQPQQVPQILYVGRMHYSKGPHLVIAAALKMHAQGIPFKLRMVGGTWLGAGAPASKYEVDLRRAAEPLRDSVEFNPFVERALMPSIYRDADIFCAPSTCNEAFGLTVLEAMASGLPLVASTRGAIPEVAGNAALYFDPRDDGALATHLTRLIVQPDTRLPLAALGQARARQLNWNTSYSSLRASLGW